METLLADLRLARDHTLFSHSMDFQYKPFDQARNSIRVLDLKPGGLHDHFEIDLRTIYLGDRPTYQALSYTWGEPTATTALFINGKGSMTIIHNLDEALRHIRSETHTKTLWIDAICIDQRNSIEKADQVRKMLDIYRAADQVLVWLWSKAQDSDLAIDLVQRIPTLDFSRLRSGLGEADLRKWGALKGLFQRPWWRRVWVNM